MKIKTKPYNLKHYLLKNLVIWLGGLFIFTFFAGKCFGLPEIDNTSGKVTIQNPDASTMQIDASDKAIINYASFDIAENESVIVNLPSVNNEILNRVLGNKASEILGKLSCNGIFILVNQNGIYFGPSAQVDVAGLIASTRDITNQDFLDSRYIFSRLTQEQMNALLLNQGKINIKEGGFGIMIAGAIDNQGTIAAPVGTIALASGDMVRIDISPSGAISVAIDQAQASGILDYSGKPITDQIKNTGTLQADEGIVLLKAESVPDIFKLAVNLQGIVQADRLTAKDGAVKIYSSSDVKVNARVSAEAVEIGSASEGLPKNVLIEGGALTAGTGGVTVLAKNDLTTKADITAVNGDINLFADYDGDSLGRFTQSLGTIYATGLGNVFIDGSEVMTLAKIATDYGYIKAGSQRPPASISGSPHYVHTKGDITITEKDAGVITTERGDILRYSPQGSLTLEATSGTIQDLTPTPLSVNYLTLIANSIKATSYSQTTEIYKNLGDLVIEKADPNDNLITLEGDDLKVAYLKTNNLTLKSDNSIRTSPGVIIQAAQVKLIGKQFGTLEIPLNINAAITYILRTSGEINIAGSTGIGTSIMITGPPSDGFGAITYSHETNLILEAGRITISPETDSIHLYGNITFSNLYCDTAGTTIYFEAGHTYTITGTTHLTGAKNEDGSINYVSLLSSEKGIRWYIDPRGAHEMSYTYAEDSYNLDPRLIVGTSLNHDANSYNWDADRYWVGRDVTYPTYWNDTNNWSATDGGSEPGGVSVPASTDDVYFTSTRNLACSVNTTASIASLTISSGYTSTIALSTNKNMTISGAYSQAGGTVTVGGNRLNVGTTFTLSAGTYNAGSSVLKSSTIGGNITVSAGAAFNMGGGNLTVSGNMTVAAGTFTKSTGTLNFASGTGTQQLTSNANDMGDIKISSNTTNTTLTLQDNLDADAITIDANQTLSVDDTEADRDITCAGNWTNWGDAGFTYGIGTVTFDGTGQVVIGTTTFYNFSKTVASADTLYFFPTYAGTTATYTFATGGTLTLKGADSNLLSLRCYASLNLFWNIQVNGSTDIDYVDVNSGYSNGYAGADAGLLIGAPVANRKVNSGHNWGWFYNYTWDGSSDNNWSTAANWTYNSGTPATLPGQYDTAVISSGTPALDATTPAVTLGYLRVTGGTLAVATYSLTATEIYNTGTITVSTGTVDSNDEFTVGTLTCSGAATINVGRDWLGVTAFTPSTSTVNFDCSLPINAYITSGSAVLKAFNNLVINDSAGGATFYLEDALDVNGNLTITGGTLNTNSSENNSINAAGNWANSDTFTANSGTVTFDGSSGTQDINSGGSSFYNVTLDYNTFSLSTNSMTVGNNLVIADGHTPTITSTAGESFTVSGTTDGTNGGSAETLTLSMGTGDITFTGAVGGTEALQTFTVTDADDVAIAAVTTRNGGISVATSGASPTITLNGNLSTDSAVTAGAVGLTGPVTLGASITIDTNAATADANISFSTTINADDDANSRTLSLDSGTGDISIWGAVGGTEALQTFTVTDADDVIIGAVTTRNGGISVATSGASPTIYLMNNLSTDSTATAGAVGLTGPVTISVGITIDTNAATTDANISFSSTVDGAYVLFLDSGTGDITVSGAVGGSTPLSGLTVSSSLTSSFQAVTTTGAQSYTATTSTTLNGDLHLNTAGTIAFTGPVLLATGAIEIHNEGGINTDDITFSGTSTINGGKALTLTATTLGDITASAAMGGTTPLTSLTVSAGDAVSLKAVSTNAGVINLQNTGTTTLNGNLTTDNAGAGTTAGAVTVTGAATLGASITIDTNASTTDANISFSTTVNADAAANSRTLSLNSGTGDITISGAVGGTEALQTFTVTDADDVALAGVTTRNGGISVATSGASPSITLNGNLSTDSAATAGTVGLTGPVTLGGNITIDTNATTTDANITFSTTIDGAFTLTLDSGTDGDIAVSGNIGATASLGGLTITQSDDTTFSGSVSATTVTLTDTDNAITFSGSVAITTLNTASQSYSLAFNAGGTIGVVTTRFFNTGGVTIGNDNNDITTFTWGLGGVTSTPTIQGTIRTNGYGINLVGYTVVLGGSGSGLATIDTTNNGAVAAGANIDLGRVQGYNNSLIINAGTAGDVKLPALENNVDSFTITNAHDYDSYYDTLANTINLNDSTGTISFWCEGATHAIGTLNTAAKGYSVSFGSDITITNDCTFLNTGTVTFGDGVGTITFTGGLDTSTGPSSTIIGDGTTVRTNGQRMDIGALAPAGTATLQTDNSAPAGAILNISAVTGAGTLLNVDAGTGGVITIASLGANGAALSTFTVTDSGGATVSGSVYVATITTTAEDYSLALNGGGTITNDCTFLNTGGITLGNATADDITFTAGLDTTVGATTAAGKVRTNGSRMDIGTLTLTTDTTLDTTGNGSTATGAILNVGAISGSGKNITLNSGTAGNTTVSGNMGSGAARLGTVTVTGANTLSGQAVTATSYTQNSGTASYASDMDLSDNFTLAGGTFNNGAITLTVGGDFDIDGTFNAGTGEVVFDDNSQTTHIYGTTFNDLTCTTAGKELQFEAGSTETINGTLTFTGSQGSPILLRSITDTSQWNIDPKGTINISYVDVKDSVNQNGVAINPANSTNSSNNIDWFSSGATPPENIPQPEEVAVEVSAAASREFLFEEANKFKKNYPKGKYRTVVIVYEGRVLVSPYDEKGLKEGTYLTAGEETKQAGEVK